MDFCGITSPAKATSRTCAHRAWIHQKRDVGCALAHLVQRLGGVAQVGKVLLVANRFFRKLQHAFQQTLMQLHDIQRLLASRKAGKELCAGGFGECRRKARSAVTASSAVPARPRSRQKRSGAGSVKPGVDLFDFKEAAAGFLKLIRRKRVQRMHHAMSGQHQQSRIVHVDEGHHDKLVGGIRDPQLPACCGAAFIAKVERSFVAVMAIGNHQLFVAHLVLNRRQSRRHQRFARRGVRLRIRQPRRSRGALLVRA